MHACLLFFVFDSSYKPPFWWLVDKLSDNFKVWWYAHWKVAQNTCVPTLFKRLPGYILLVANQSQALITTEDVKIR